MAIVGMAVGQPRVFVVGVLSGAVLVAVGFLLALTMVERAGATHAAGNSVHACVSRYTGQARIMLPGRAPACSSGEVLVEWPGQSAAADLAALMTRVDALEAQVPDCLSDENGTALFTGCNVQIVNGSGTTDNANGTGNLIVGYDEVPPWTTFERTGSHNVVIGKWHGYSSYGGLVAGLANQVTGPYASVSGGVDNVASGEAASVSGGQLNYATYYYASISGGIDNVASGDNSSVSGGYQNVASGSISSVSGGSGNTASGSFASVHGGQSNEASAPYAVVSGGFERTAAGTHDWVGGSLSEDF